MVETFEYWGETFKWVDGCSRERLDDSFGGWLDNDDLLVGVNGARLATSPDWETPKEPEAVDLDAATAALWKLGIGVTFLGMTSNSGAVGTTFIEIRGRTTRSVMWGGGG